MPVIRLFYEMSVCFENWVVAAFFFYFFLLHVYKIQEYSLTVDCEIDLQIWCQIQIYSRNATMT